MFGSKKKIRELEQKIIDLGQENRSLRERLADAERLCEVSRQRCAGTEQHSRDLQKLFGRPVDLLTMPALQNPYLRNAVDQTGVELYAA